MATKKVGIYRKYHGKVPVENGRPVPKSQWPKKRHFSWVVRWFGTDGNRYSRSFKTRKEAKRFAEQKQTEVREGRSDPPPVVRLKDFTREHVKLMRGQTAYNTLREQERCLRKLREVIGDKPLHEVTAKDAETYVNRRHGAGKSASTINKEIMTLRRVFNLAASRRRYLPEGQNPFKKVKKRKVSRKPIRYVSAEEMRRLLAEAPTLRWRAFLTLLYTTGLRLNEACHLTWANIDFENGMLQVSAKRDTTTTVPWEPKDHELRHIPVSPGSLKVLAEWQAEAPEGVPYAFVTLERYRRVM